MCAPSENGIRSVTSTALTLKEAGRRRASLGGIDAAAKTAAGAPSVGTGSSPGATFPQWLEGSEVLVVAAGCLRNSEAGDLSAHRQLPVGFFSEYGQQHRVEQVRSSS